MGNVCLKKNETNADNNKNENNDNSIQTNGIVMNISEHGFENFNLGADENRSKSSSVSSVSSSSSSSNTSSPMKIISSLWLSEKSKGKMKGIGSDDKQNDIKNNNIETGLLIKLLQHKHTLFCERKQRVCDAYGKIQELEILQIQNIDEIGNKLEVSFKNSFWLRSKSISDEFVIIEGSDNKIDYTLTKDDVGCFICFKHKLDNNNDYHTLKPIGPVLPGPPRLLEIRIIGETKVGNRIVAKSKYIGGYEGTSEYWWIRIKDGEREQITEPRAIKIENLYQEAFILPETDPRVHIITNEDKGCCFKAKCRPARSDGYKGEIVTSLQSETVEI